MEPDLARLILRHRHVGPMLSALLSGTNAGVRISSEDGVVILEREAAGIGFEKFPITVEGRTVGWVEGDRAARAIASVLSYAVSREADKRSLAREALDRYRELNLVYQLADRLSGELDIDAVGQIVVAEASKLSAGGSGFLLVRDDADLLHPVAAAPGPDAPTGPDAPPFPVASIDQGIVGAVARSGSAEEINDVAADPRATASERGYA